MTKLEVNAPTGAFSSFGFRDSFVICHSCFVIFSLIALAS